MALDPISRVCDASRNITNMETNNRADLVNFAIMISWISISRQRIAHKIALVTY